jgi:hypothetical protein
MGNNTVTSLTEGALLRLIQICLEETGVEEDTTNNRRLVKDLALDHLEKLFFEADGMREFVLSTTLKLIGESSAKSLTKIAPAERDELIDLIDTEMFAMVFRELSTRPGTVFYEWRMRVENSIDRYFDRRIKI